MNTKDAIWINKCKHYEKSLHTIKYSTLDKSSVFFTLGEEGRMEIKIEEDTSNSSFVLLHTPSDYLYFTSDGIKGEMFSLKIDIQKGVGNNLKVEKNMEELSFFSNNEKLLTITHPSFFGSASIGVESKGKGDTVITVF